MDSSVSRPVSHDHQISSHEFSAPASHMVYLQESLLVKTFQTKLEISSWPPGECYASALQEV